MKTVVLLVPNFRWVDTDNNALWHYLPYNLCLIAACIRDICNVHIVDAYKEDMSSVQLHARLRQLNPDIVGITVLMDKYGPAGHIVANIAKQLGALVVMGGVYASINAEEVIKDTNVDYVVKGEGEYIFRAIIEHPDQPNKIMESGRIGNLDLLPLPAYDLIDFKAYATAYDRKSVDAPRVLPYGRVLTSRGCQFGCIFCQVEQISGAKFRARSPENVLKEIRWLRDTHGVKSLIFDDDNLLTDVGRAEHLFQGMIDEGLVMPWLMIATAAFKLDESLIKLMRRSGCEYVNIAIESGTNRILHEVIHKPIHLKSATEVCCMLQRAGIYVAANFIIGFPTETWEEIRETLRFAEEFGADYTKIFAAMPLRNTKLWDLCVQENAFKKGFNGTVQWSSGQIETSEFTANDLTILRAYEWDRLNFLSSSKRKQTCAMMNITEEELLKIRKNTLQNALKAIS